MLAVWLYRSGQKKLQERRAHRQQNSDVQQPVDTSTSSSAPQSPPSQSASPRIEEEQRGKWHMSSEAKWNIVLLLALAFPVFLETLDYTGERVRPLP